MKVVISNKELGITVTQSESKAKLFTVTYGLQVSKHLDYGQAAQEYGECVFHALSCEAVIDNSESY